MSPEAPLTLRRNSSALKDSDRGLDIDGAERIARALLDDEGQEEALLVLVCVGAGRSDAHVGIAVLQVEAAQKLAVEIQAVGVVDGGRPQEIEDVRLGGADGAAQLGVAERSVADEIHANDFRLGAFADLENEIDAVVIQLDDLRIDLGRIVSLAAVDVQDLLHVGVGPRACVEAARLELRLFRKRIGGNLLGALERHPVDELRLGDLDDNRASVELDAGIAKQPGPEQGFHAFVCLARVIALAGLKSQVVLDCFRVEALIAQNADLPDDNAVFRFCRGRGEEGCSRHNYERERQIKPSRTCAFTHR